jgi:hypothetical protein
MKNTIIFTSIIASITMVGCVSTAPSEADLSAMSSVLNTSTQIIKETCTGDSSFNRELPSCRYDNLKNIVKLTVGHEQDVNHGSLYSNAKFYASSNSNIEFLTVSIGSGDWCFANKRVELYSDKHGQLTGDAARYETHIQKSGHHSVPNILQESATHLLTPELSEKIISSQKVTARWYCEGGYKDLNVSRAPEYAKTFNDAKSKLGINP